MGYQGILSGLEDDQLIPASQLIKAYLPEQRSAVFWKDRKFYSKVYWGAALACIMLRHGGVPFLGIKFFDGGLGWVTPITCFVFLFALPILWLVSRFKAKGLPFDMPIQANRPDPSNLDHNGRPTKAAGAVFIGVERKSGKWVWLALNKVTQHLTLPGTTGAGKSSMLLGLITNALVQGSGAFEIDAKGDLKFMNQIIALSRMFCRDADIRILNFLNADPYVSESYNSNTFNMLSMAPADDISSLISSLKSGMGKENEVFSARSTALVSAVVRARVWLRDNLGLPMSIGDLRDSIMEVDPLIRLALGCDENGVEYNLTAEFQEYTEGIWSYMGTFVSRADILAHAAETLGINPLHLRFLAKENRQQPPKYNPENLAEFKKQHGFATMPLSQAFQNMVGDYKRIFGCSNGNVTIDDAIKNRRIVISMLPAMGKSRQDTLSAAKILVSNIRGMASRALGTRTYGNMDELVKSQITNANSPYLIIFEEAGPYVQDGMDQLYQQARGLNFWIVTAFQDIPGLERNDAAIAKSIIGNANYPIFMRLQDPSQTGKLAKEQGESDYASLVRSFEEKSTFLPGKRSVDAPSRNIEKMERVSFRDLQSQLVGQGTMIAEGKVVRLNAFYCEPLSCVPTHRMTTNIRRFAAWPLPTRDQITLVKLPPAGAKSAQATPAKGTDAKPLARSESPTPSPARQSAPQNTPQQPSNQTAEVALKSMTSAGMIFGGPKFEEANLSTFFEGGQETEQTGGYDHYANFYDNLKASEEFRVQTDEIEAGMYKQRAEKIGAVNLWDEFIAMSFSGLEVVQKPEATMDIGTMTLGLFSLSAIRGRFRRDGKLPPYIPNSWTTRRILGGDELLAEWREEVDDETDQSDLLARTGPPLGSDSALPEPLYFARHNRGADDDLAEVAPDPDEDHGDTTGTIDEIMRLQGKGD